MVPVIKADLKQACLHPTFCAACSLAHANERPRVAFIVMATV
jgi:hypothetical protein